MAIIVEHGTGEAELGMAKLAADQIRADKEQARSDALLIEAQRLDQREREFQAQLNQRAYEFEKKLEFDKFQIDLGYEAKKQARVWELEKMEARSRLDFEREERQRQEKLDKYDAAVKAIQERDDLDPEEKDNFLFMAEMKYLGQPDIARETMQDEGSKSLLEQYGLIDEPQTEIQEHIESVSDKQEIQEMLSITPTTEEGFTQIVKGLAERDPAQAQAYYLEHRKKFMSPEESAQVTAQETITRTEIDERRQGMLAYPEFLKTRGTRDSEYQWKKYQAYATAYMKGDTNRANRMLVGGALSRTPSQSFRK